MLRLEPPKYTPEWDEGFQGWTVKFINEHAWKVPTYTFDDLMQEMKAEWCYCVDRYPLINNQGWLMHMYKLAATGRMYDLAMKEYNRRKYYAFAHELGSDEEDGYTVDGVGDTDTYAPLVEAVEKAPEEVRAVLRLLLDSPSEVLQAVCSAWGGRGARGVFSNAHLCALLGYDPAKVDLPKLVREYLST